MANHVKFVTKVSSMGEKKILIAPKAGHKELTAQENVALMVFMNLSFT